MYLNYSGLSISFDFLRGKLIFLLNLLLKTCIGSVLEAYSILMIELVFPSGTESFFLFFSTERLRRQLSLIPPQLMYWVSSELSRVVTLGSSLVLGDHPSLILSSTFLSLERAIGASLPFLAWIGSLPLLLLARNSIILL